MSQMGRYVTGFKLRVQEMEKTGPALPGLFVLETVEQATEQLKELTIPAVLANFEIQPKAQQTAKVLLDS